MQEKCPTNAKVSIIQEWLRVSFSWNITQHSTQYALCLLSSHRQCTIGSFFAPPLNVWSPKKTPKSVIMNKNKFYFMSYHSYSCFSQAIRPRPIIWLSQYLVCREVEDDNARWLDFSTLNFILLTMTSPPGYMRMTSSVCFQRGIKWLRVTNDITSGYPLARSGQAWWSGHSLKSDWQY